jgi:heat shock protein HtpX
MLMKTAPARVPLLQRWSDREALRLRQAFIEHQTAGALPEVSNWRSALALILAGLVLMGYLLTLLLGLWATWQAILGLRSGSFQALSMGLLALLCLMFCWLGRPRFGTRPERLVSREEAPELHALVAEVASLMGAPVPHYLRLDAQVNASVTREGFPPRFSLTLGLPLMFGLRPQERVDLIAHELAHEVSGDPLRGLWIGAAMNVLWAVNLVLYPEDWASLRSIPEYLANALRWVLILPFHGLLWLFQALLGQDSQHAEFRADLNAASVAGSEAAISGLDKLHFTHLFEYALQKQRSSPERPHAFLELRHAWDHLKPAEQERMRLQVAQERLRLDRSHPPTADRIAVLAAHPLGARLTLSPGRAALIEAELTPFVARLEAQAYDAYRERYSAG